MEYYICKDKQFHFNPEYIEWLVSLIDSPDHDEDLDYYSFLINKLFRMPFRYDIRMDENRVDDAKNLRITFRNIHGYFTFAEGCVCVNGDDVSVLEIMIALIMRCYETKFSVYDPPSVVNLHGYPEKITPGFIFWEMIKNMGLYGQENQHFNEDIVEYRVNDVLDHEYDANGNGGMFTIPNTKYDMRKADLWYQMEWWAAYVFSIMEVN